MKIVATGSLGHIGLPLVKELIQRGHSVCVVSHSNERGKEIESLGASAAIGSVEDVLFLTETFAEADAVFLMLPPDYRVADHIAYSRRIGENYAEAVRRSEVKRAVYLSSWGADRDSGTGFILGTHYIEATLTGLSGVALTFLRATTLYHNLFGFVGMIRNEGAISTNYGGSDRFVLAHPLDIASVAVEELESANERSRVRYVASDECTADELSGVLGRAIGLPDLQWHILTDEEYLSRLQMAGVPPYVAKMTVEMGSAHHSGALIADYEFHRPVKMGKMKIADFAAEFAAAYAAV